MKRVLLAGVLLFLLIHGQQAIQRCRQADGRARAAQAELESFEEALKEWPQLRLQASEVRPIAEVDPRQLPHSPALQVEFREDKIDDQPIFRMQLRGSRNEVVRELQVLVQHFCLIRLELKSRPEGQIQGHAVLVAVP